MSRQSLGHHAQLWWVKKTFLDAVLEFFLLYLNWDQKEHYSPDLCKYNDTSAQKTVLPLLLDWAFSLCLKRSYLWACKQSAGGKEFKGCPWVNSGGLFMRASCMCTLHLPVLTSRCSPCLGRMVVPRPWESHFLSVLEGLMVTSWPQKEGREDFKAHMSAMGKVGPGNWFFMAPSWHWISQTLVMAAAAAKWCVLSVERDVWTEVY